MEHVLAVDLGTGGPKVALVAVDGTITDSEVGVIHVLLGPDGAAEQDPDEWWRAITRAVQRIMARTHVSTKAIGAIAVTSQWSGTVAVGADGRHLMNSLIWMDSRGARYVRDVVGGRVRVAGYGVGKLLQFVRLAGGLPGHSGKDPTAHILWIRNERPDVYAATRVFLEPADYMNLRLTGRACSSYDCIALHWVTDTRNVRAVRYDSSLVRASGLERGRLPELVPSATIIGSLRARVAREWGLREGTPVATACGDVASAVIGSGAISDYAGHLYIGTSSWLSCHVPFKRADVLHNQTTLPAALPGRYYIVNENETAGACLAFLKDNMLVRPAGLAPGANEDRVYSALDVIASRADPGAARIIFTPWLNGERTPVDDRTLRGGFHNLSLAVTQADLVRSVFEGVAYNSRWLLSTVEHFARRTLPALAFIGGGARSALWSQIHADVLDRSIRRIAQPHLANARGAAFVAFVALGLLRPDDIAQRVPVVSEHEPDPRNRGLYDELYGAFRDIYRQNRSIYAVLNQN